ncbi:hypothetical protein AURDEDRAFT_123860 [Auricularia subglabra TFB-10046 SS5]|nr:hypothetical protein AURDEDRAFT_123860 [Auricularia subglabra TFB-10046 SS5]
MPLPPSLCDDFYKWGLPKLRSLVDARVEDAKAGIKRYGAFHKLREEYLEEFEQHPFARPDFPEYLDDDGNVTYESGEIREKASTWFRNHARPEKSKKLANFESAGGISQRTGSRAKSAAELWATDEKALIRKSALKALGLPESTGNNAFPAEWIGARKAAIACEFALLPQEEQDEWHTLARNEKAVSDNEQASVISIQERQLGFATWLRHTVNGKIKGGSLGDTFVIQFSGYCVRAADRRLERFRGQLDTGENPPKWFLSDGYKDLVAPVWADFVHKDVEGATLKEHREDLTRYFEEMFRLACDFGTLDVIGFWKDVAEHPDKYVSPDRMPEGISFAHPKKLPVDDFYEVYQHAWLCQNKPESVEHDARFIYEAEAVRDTVTLERAAFLKRKLKRKARKAAAAGAPDDGSNKSSATSDAENAPAPQPSQPASTAPPTTRDGADVAPRSVENSGSIPSCRQGDDGSAAPPLSSRTSRHAGKGTTAPPPASPPPASTPPSSTPRASKPGASQPPTSRSPAVTPPASQLATLHPTASQPAVSPTAGSKQAPKSRRGRATNLTKTKAPAAARGRKSAQRPSDEVNDGDGSDQETPQEKPKSRARPPAKKPRTEDEGTVEQTRYPTRRKAEGPK